MPSCLSSLHVDRFRQKFERIISMSSLLPNVDDLIKALPETEPNADARALAVAAASAQSEEELDRVLSTTVEGWLV